MEEQILRELVVNIVGEEKADKVLAGLAEHRDLIEDLGYNRETAYDKFVILCRDLAAELASCCQLRRMNMKMKTFGEAFPDTTRSYTKPHVCGKIVRPSLARTLNRFVHFLQSVGFSGVQFVEVSCHAGCSWEGFLHVMEAPSVPVPEMAGSTWPRGMK